jgi:hypothetical protein
MIHGPLLADFRIVGGCAADSWNPTIWPRIARVRVDANPVIISHREKHCEPARAPKPFPWIFSPTCRKFAPGVSSVRRETASGTNEITITGGIRGLFSQSQNSRFGSYRH